MDTVDKAARILWDYMKLGQQTQSADVLLALGSIDERVAVCAAELSMRHTYGYVMFSGGVAHTNDLLAKSWEGTEARHFYEVFMSAGGKSKQVILEEQAQNTGQNVLYSYELLHKQGLDATISTIQLVTKPYMERRAIATFTCQWPSPQPKFFVASPNILFENYPNEYQPYEKFIHIMVGDMQRIIDYPLHGWQLEQEIPDPVMRAYKQLVEAGYTAHNM